MCVYVRPGVGVASWLFLRLDVDDVLAVLELAYSLKWVDIHDADWFVVAGWSRYAQSAAVSGGQAKKLRGF